MDARSRQLEDPLIIGNICKMNAWVHLGFHIFSCIFKNSVYALKLHFHQNPSFIKWNLGKSFQNWHINLAKDLAYLFEVKKTKKKIGFRTKNSELVETLAN